MPGIYVYCKVNQGYLAVGTLEHRFWKQLCTLLDIPGYGDGQDDESCREEMLAGHDVCCRMVNRFADIFLNPLINDRQMVVCIDDGVDETQQQLGIPIKLRARHWVQPAGSSEQILADLSYTAERSSGGLKFVAGIIYHADGARYHGRHRRSSFGDYPCFHGYFFRQQAGGDSPAGQCRLACHLMVFYE